MAKQPRKSSPSLINVPPPGTLAFADGGAVRQESADELMARMAAKYGVPAAGKVQSGPAQPPTQQPQPKTQARPEQQGITSGIVGILKGRAAQIDKAAGYAEGGKISGPGTPKSDSVRATIRETGEGIRVSNGERIVSAEQDKFLEGIAKAAGYESLDAMLEDGTGKPVGPTIKAGKRAAADGLAPELDPFAYRGGPAAGITTAPGADNRIKGAIAAPPTLGAAPFARSEPDGALTNPVAGGITIDPIGPKPELGGSGQTGIGPLAAPGLAASKVGRDASGIITAESAQAAAGSDTQRSGGVFGTIDMKGVNDIMARENKARGEMIDLSIKANGGNGVAVLPDYQPPQQGGISISDIQSAMKSAGTRTERAAYGQALQTMLAGQNQAGIEQMRQDGNAGAEMARLGLTARAQDLGLQRAQERNDIIVRGQDVRAGTAADRIASSESIAAARLTERSAPTLSQQRGNAEIDAARSRIAGLTPDEIKRKTANYTATGRENPDFDPTLAKAVSLANRRKVGDDQDFDSRQAPEARSAATQAKFTTDDVKAAIAGGADRGKVAERIRSLGGNPAEYGL